MATQKLEEKVQQHDEVVESSKTGCKSQSRAHGKACAKVPALICETYARRILAQLPFWGVSLLSMNKTTPQMFGDQIWNSSLKFHHPPHNFDLPSEEPPLPTLRFPIKVTAVIHEVTDQVYRTIWYSILYPDPIHHLWLLFQNVIQVHFHDGKTPIVLYWEMKLQSDLHVSNEPAAATSQRFNL